MPRTKPTTAQDLEGRAEKPLRACPAPSPLDTLCAEIRAHHRERQFAMQQRKRNDNALGSHLRTSLGWHLGLPAAERKAIEARVAAAIEAAEKGTEDPVYAEFRAVIDGTILARAPFDRIEEEAGERMVDAVERLPVWSAWAKSVRGLGAKTLGTIIGETGNLDRYASDAKVWKRLGLAVMDGRRQGGLAKNAPKADWITHGYSRPRRSIMWVAGDVMVKQSSGVYRELYVARKAVEMDKAAARGQVVEAASKRTKSDPAHFMSKMHVHRRAQRYVEKRLLRDLWRAWRLAPGAIDSLPETALDTVPSAEAAILALPQGHRASAASSAAGHAASVDKTSHAVPAAILFVPRGQTSIAAGQPSPVDKTILQVPAANDDVSQDQTSAAAGHGSLVDEITTTMPAAMEIVPQGHSSFAAFTAAGHSVVVDKTNAHVPAAIERMPQGQTKFAAGHSQSVDETNADVPAARADMPQGHLPTAAGQPTFVAETIAEMPAATHRVPQGQSTDAAGQRVLVDKTTEMVPAAKPALPQGHSSPAAGHSDFVDETRAAVPAAKALP